MSTTCARKGCRKKATYELTLARYDGDGANPFVAALQGWSLCLDDRDAVQAAIGGVLRQPREVRVAGGARSRIREFTAEHVDAGQATNQPEEPQGTPVTPEAPVAPPPGRPVARPSS